MRWREWMVAVNRRNALLIAHPKWKGMYEMFMEKLNEDPFWRLQVVHAGNLKPLMIYSDEVSEDNLFIWTDAKGVQTPAEFFGPTGYGRLSIATPQRGGTQPWETANFNGEKPADLSPDPDPDEAV